MYLKVGGGSNWGDDEHFEISVCKMWHLGAKLHLQKSAVLCESRIGQRQLNVCVIDGVDGVDDA